MFWQDKKVEKKYIEEIDILRSISVLMVVLFHAVPDIMPGGYVGVDVFFVISGYVISRTYLHSLQDKSKSLRDFYIARFRRLAPALILMLVIITAFSVIFLYPDNLISYSEVLISQILYLQNFVFWVEGDYFQKALQKPLLNTWSLAVEEQFYIVWAFLIFIFRRSWRIAVGVLILVTIFSILSGVFLEPRSPKTVFFMLPTRIWEFSFGIFAFLIAHHFRMIRIPGAHLVGAVMLLVIIVLALFMTESTPFPGWSVGMVCFACAIALICFERSETRLRFFGTGALQYIGKVSYGFYLWHWPPLSIFFLYTGYKAGYLEAAILVLLSFVMAVLSYHFVEQPIRHRRYFTSPRTMMTAMVSGLAVVAALAVGLQSTGGGLFLYAKEVRPFFSAVVDTGSFRCSKLYTVQNPGAQICPVNETSGPGKILLLGDSHADILDEMLGALGDEMNVQVFLTVRNCDFGSYGQYAFCSRKVMQDVVKEARSLGIRRVLAVSYWDHDKLSEQAFAEQATYFIEHGLEVQAMKVVPHHASYHPGARARAAISGQALDFSGISTADYEGLTREFSAMMAGVRQKAGLGFSVIDPGSRLCDAVACRYAIDGLPLYTDSNHLSSAGAKVLRPMFRDIFASLDK